MPRAYPEWDMSDESRQSLNEKANAAHFAAAPDPQTPADIRAMQDRYGKNQLIEWLSGTADKASRAWKSARDGLSRRRSGRGGIGKLWRQKFQTAGRKAATRGLRAQGSTNVTITADVKVSSKWDRGRPMYASLSGSELSDYLDALESGNIEAAAMVVADSYGIPPESITELDNISGWETDAAQLDGADED